MPAAGVRSNTPNDTPPEHPAIDPVKGGHMRHPAVTRMVLPGSVIAAGLDMTI